MNKYFRDMITSKSLQAKLALVEPQAESQHEAAPKAFFKNVCAPISMDLFQELEGVLSVLSISKARFLTLAIASAVDDAKGIMKEVDVTEYLREFNQAVEAQSQDEAA